MNEEPIPLEREPILEYLDDAIITWRNRRDDDGLEQKDRDIAIYYVDAFQAMRESFFGECLPGKASLTSVCDTLHNLFHHDESGLQIWRQAWRAAVSHTLNEIRDSVKSKLVERV